MAQHTGSTTRLGALRATVWPGVFAALAGLGLLLAFYQVVRGAVDQGALRRQAAALYADASWRCQWASGLGASQRCLAQLDAAPQGRLQALGSVATLAGR